MATLPNNFLKDVATFQKAEMAWMLNQNVGIDISNKKFKDFQTRTAQLGDTVTFDLAPRASFQNGLVISTQSSVQRPQSLVCSQAGNSSTAYSNQQLIFNDVDDYMDRFGRSRISEIGGNIESDILTNFISQVRVNNPQDPRFGQIADPTSGPFRFFGDGVNPINSFEQLAQAQANFTSFGAANFDMIGIIPSLAVPRIVQSGLSNFTVNRGNETASSWEFSNVGDFSWRMSNLLPIHTAGTVGEQVQTLTLVSTNDPTGNNITQLTFSGASPNDVNAFKAGDLCQFNDGVGSLPNVRFRTFIAHKVTNLPVQFRVLNDAAANGSGNVTIDIYPALCATSGNQNQNLSVNLQAGMQIATLPSHQAGCLMSGSPLYLAMPALEDVDPYTTVVATDKESGVSIRHYFGSQFGQNVKAYVWDAIWGSTLVAENSMRMIFPLAA